MNVYDFDDTIYRGDSSKDFIIYVALQHPLKMIRELPGQAIAAVLYLMGIIDKKQMKERFFRFVTKMNNLEMDVSKFWDLNEHKIKAWYLKQRCIDDVIISASPSFLLKEICRRLEIKYLMATEFDTLTGVILGENCKGEEKVSRFYNMFPDGEINLFYSDSYSDVYLANEAQKSYLVKGNRIVEWEFE